MSKDKGSISLGAAIIIAIIVISSISILTYKLIIKDRNVEQDIETRVGEYSTVDVNDLIATKDSPFSAEVVSATTTGVYRVGGKASAIDFNIHTITASSSGHIAYYLEVSNNPDCATSTSDTSKDTYIKWAGVDPQSSTSGSDTTYQAATTTYYWTPGSGSHGLNHQLTDVNCECIRITLGSASTTAWVEMKIKENR